MQLLVKIVFDCVLNTPLEMLTIFARSFILDVLLGFIYVYDIKVKFLFGWNSESSYIEWQPLRGVPEEHLLEQLWKFLYTF